MVSVCSSQSVSCRFSRRPCLESFEEQDGECRRKTLDIKLCLHTLMHGCAHPSDIIHYPLPSLLILLERKSGFKWLQLP